MIWGDDSTEPVTSAVVVAGIGVEHVWLSYDYLDRGDVDGYGSLLAPDAVLVRPDGRDVRGRAAIEGWLAARASGTSGTNTVTSVFAAAGNVIAIGHYAGIDAEGHPRDVDFTDIFTIAPSGLLRSMKRYFFVHLSG
ncbi:nuclear transport factor 2 family protein [Actinophytocola sp. NPDC049390]|uniref:nuclear transport factor 2 family protein n=1 Tax=Actinophytocola sp. NPDC049390 TaxID=3363894 RepID=UPI0037A55916